MASLLRLTNEVALAVDARNPSQRLRSAAGEFEHTILTAPRRIGLHLRKWLAKRDRPEIFTYSYSSTVAGALLLARRQIHRVSCSESRPGNEGFRTARALAEGGMRVTFYTDAVLFSQLWGEEILLLGVDAVLKGWVAAKVGAKVLVARAKEVGCPVIFLTDTTKFWSEPTRSSRRWNWTFGPNDELWRRPPKDVSIHNPYFELLPLGSRARFLTERGWMDTRQVRQEIRKIPVSPHLRRMMD